MDLEDISGGKQVLRAAALCFSEKGQESAQRISGLEVYRYGQEFTETRHMVRKLLTGDSRVSALLFFSSVGIAVRLIAPYIQDKMTDPAVLVVNDTADFIIPVLSGHMGQANVLAEHVAEILSAQPVITTASDHRNGLEAPDLWAAREGYTIQNRKDLKEVTAAMVAGGRAERIRRGEDVVWRVFTGDLQGVQGKCVAAAAMSPRKYVVGLGCRRGTDPESLRLFVEKQLKETGIRKDQVFKICSIELKSEELAVQNLAMKWNRPFVVFSAEQLNRLEGVFSASPFVRKTTGTDNVCERSAIAGCGPGGGKLLLPKNAENGMTLALAERNL